MKARHLVEEYDEAVFLSNDGGMTSNDIAVQVERRRKVGVEETSINMLY